MERDNDIVDLGTACVETQGFRPGIGDEVQGAPLAGLLDD